MIVSLDLADPRQAAALHRIWLAAYAQEAALLGIPAALFPPLQRSVAELQASGLQFLGVVQQDTFVGAIGLEKLADAILISALVVAPEHQRLGLGRQLMTEALKRYQGHALRVSTGAANLPALALYEALGFVPSLRETVGSPPVEIVRLERPA